ncbi:hypothetical protein [Ornithinimicrobium murale]|uniref:hypothetical protein n=1 Tax=Ornithinimicrobium murale TaxID=1050153 RepID=UPI000E0DA5EB|nr:hypothetical protein [Ornithinimicrobium murale]
MKRLMTGVVAAAMLVPALTACGGSDSDFCDQEVGADIGINNPAAAKEALQDAVDDAPDEIKDDLQLVVDSLDDLEAGNLEDVDTDGLTEASNNIQSWYEENCEAA